MAAEPSPTCARAASAARLMRARSTKLDVVGLNDPRDTDPLDGRELADKSATDEKDGGRPAVDIERVGDEGGNDASDHGVETGRDPAAEVDASDGGGATPAMPAPTADAGGRGSTAPYSSASSTASVSMEGML